MPFPKNYTPWNKGLKNWRKPIVFSLETRKKMSESAKKRGPSFLGKHHSEETKRKLREARLKQPCPRTGVKMSEKQKEHYRNLYKGRRFSPSTEFIKGVQNNPNGGFKKGHKLGVRFKKGHKTWNKGLEGYMAGEKNFNWKGGITPLNLKIRQSFKYKKWREAVFKRDNWTCVNCNQRGGRLNADHIKPFALYPKLRLKVSNGRTLCEKVCHKKIGWRGSHIKNKKYGK
jgi:hypothetical protein